VQADVLSVFITGQKEEENWDVEARSSSYPDLTAVVTETLERAGVKAQSTASASELYRQATAWMVGGKVVATVGIVDEKVRKAFDVRQAVYYAEIDWTYITKKSQKRKIKVQDIARFPSVRRDFSLLLDEGIEFQRIEELALKQGGKLIKEVGLFDVYEGKNLPKGKKSYAVSFLIQDEQKTLTDKVVDKLMSKVQMTLEQELGCELRS
jgi:phenylalanyl-tRNA synthetase beta chain